MENVTQISDQMSQIRDSSITKRRHNKDTICKRPCQVCGDTNKSTNWSFGAVVCEACKKFFVRHQKNKPLVCPFRATCPVTVTSRSSCTFCRFKKCLDLGMNIECKPLEKLWIFASTTFSPILITR